MPQFEGGSAADQTAVTNAIRNMRNRLQPQITNPELQQCIRKQAQSDNTIHIDGDECHTYMLGYHELWKVGPFTVKSDDIHICVNNHNTRGLPPAELENTLMHEWAHSCCWEHGDGKGVPL